MTDPRMLRLLAIANELRGIAAELDGSVHVIWTDPTDPTGARTVSTDLMFHDVLPPLAEPIEWTKQGDGLCGRFMIAGMRGYVHLGADHVHLAPPTVS